MLTEQYERKIPVDKLMMILDILPESALVEVNRVGNLAISMGRKYIGYIDLATEEYDKFPEGWG